MQKNRPAKNHICFMSKNNQWQARTFLPLYDEKLVWAEDVNDTLCQHRQNQSGNRKNPAQGSAGKRGDHQPVPGRILGL